MLPKIHPRCRPPRGAMGIAESTTKGYFAARKPLRLGVRGWSKYDNGKPSVAFLGSLSGQNIAWVASCKCRDATCPRWKALEYAREKLGLESVIVHERPSVR